MRFARGVRQVPCTVEVYHCEELVSVCCCEDSFDYNGPEVLVMS